MRRHPQASALRCLSLALAALLLSAGCSAFPVQPRTSTYVFPDSLVNADLGPGEVRRSDEDLFGWAPDARGGDEATTLIAHAGGHDVDAHNTTPSQREDATQATAAIARAEQVRRPPRREPARPLPVEPGAASVIPDLPDAPPPAAYDEALAVAYVHDLYRVNGLGLPDGSTRALYRVAVERGQVYHDPVPLVGDLVFFHNTRDRDGDARWDDWYTLVGVVEAVGDDGVVSALAFIGGRVRRLRLDVAHPDVLVDPDTGARRNTRLRAPGPDGLSGAAGRQFAGFASLLPPDADSFIVIDNWHPDLRERFQASVREQVGALEHTSALDLDDPAPDDRPAPSAVLELDDLLDQMDAAAPSL